MPGKRDHELLRSLAQKDLLLPYFKNAILSEDWPDEYTIKIDSRPYYGLGDGYFHPSTHGLMDERRLYYHFHPDTAHKMLYDPRDVQSEMTLSMGSALHGVVQTQLQQAKLLRPENVEVEFIIEEHHVRGRTDMIVDLPGLGETVVELKTQNSRAFAFQEEMKDFWQVQLSLALYGLGHEFGILLVLESGFPYRMKEYHYERDDDLLARVFAKFDYVRECIENNTPPPHCCTKGSKVMDACPARYSCWLKDQVRPYVEPE